MNDTSYTWSSSFVLPYESKWSIEEKFCYLNALHSIGSGKNKINIPVPEDYKTYSTKKGAPFYEHCEKICPICIRSGYHSVIHNLEYLDYCFIHSGTRLESCHHHTQAREFEKGEPLLYEFLPHVRTIDLITNQKLRLKIEAYKTLVQNMFPDYLHIVDFKNDKKYGNYGVLYENTKFSLAERCFMPNNPWFKGNDRIILQIDSSEIASMSRKSLWKAAKYCRKRNPDMIPSKIFSYAKNIKYIKQNDCEFRLGIIFKNYFEDKILELFDTKKEYIGWSYHISNCKNLKLNSMKQYLQVSMYLIYRSISCSNLFSDDAISQWENINYTWLDNYMQVEFFDINYLENDVVEYPNKLDLLCFQDIIMRDALNYAIQELCHIARQKLINLENGIMNSYYPVKFPQYIIKRTADKWTIIACDPPKGLPANFSAYEEIYLEYTNKLRTAVNSISKKITTKK